MTVDHIFNNHMYIISNHAVALNPIFNEKRLCIRFLKKLDYYLAPLCDIIHYSLDENQFQIIIKLKSRKVFEEYFLAKKMNLKKAVEEIPHSTYIFSQAMANLQASCAIHFNRKFGRSGALFARRFRKILVDSRESLNMWILRLNKMKKVLQYVGKWRCVGKKRGFSGSRRKWIKKVKELKERCGWIYYKFLQLGHKYLSNFRRIAEIDLQGQFKNLPPERISPKTSISLPS